MADKYDDNIQHGIDDDPNNDPEKARNIGGVGGAVTGAIAGAAAGPLGAIGGAVVGAVVGGLGSQAAVAAVDRVDNDDTITGIGHGVTRDKGYIDTPGNGVPGIQTGGHAVDGTPDTRGVSEKVADTLTGDKYDDKTGKRIDGAPSAYGTNDAPPTYREHGNGIPGVQTGGHAADGTPDTRGITEKVADKLTGDRIDDKTGKPVV